MNFSKDIREVNTPEFRLEICNNCDKLNPINICKVCGCFMPLKTKFKSAECPLKKWKLIKE